MTFSNLWVISFAALWVLIGLIAVAQALVIRHALKLERDLLDASDGPDIGAAVPPVRLRDAAGAPQTLSPAVGRRLAVVFMSPACSACAAVARALRGLPEIEGLDVVAVCQASPDAAQRYAARKQLALPVLADPEGLTLKAYQVSGIPFAVVLDVRGQVEGKGVPGSFRDLMTLLERDRPTAIEAQAQLAPAGA